MDANIRQLLAVTDGRQWQTMHRGDNGTVATMAENGRVTHGDNGRVTRGRRIDNGSNNRNDTDATALILMLPHLQSFQINVLAYLCDDLRCYERTCK